MAKDKTEKTNVMRLLEQKKLPYTPHDYLATGAVSGVEVAAALGEPPERVFKTLVTTGASGGHYVFVIPVAEELDLKKCAAAIRIFLRRKQTTRRRTGRASSAQKKLPLISRRRCQRCSQ